MRLETAVLCAYFTSYATDATAAMFVTILTFLWPSEVPDVCCLRGGCGHPAGYKAKRREPLILWAVISKKVPWGLILLLGGGFALAESIQVGMACHKIVTFWRLKGPVFVTFDKMQLFNS